MPPLVFFLPLSSYLLKSDRIPTGRVRRKILSHTLFHHRFHSKSDHPRIVETAGTSHLQKRKNKKSAMKKSLFLKPPFPWLTPVKIPRFSIPTSILSVGCSTFALILCGCQVLTYRTPTGERLTRSSVGANTSISSLTLEGTTNGIRRIELHGYKNDTSQALGTVTEAAIKAAIGAVKP